MYTGHDIVKAFNREKESREVFDAYNDKLCESGWKSQFLSGIMMPVTMLIGNLAYVAVCLLGGYLAINGKVSIGDIQAFIQYVRSFNQPISQVANVANSSSLQRPQQSVYSSCWKKRRKRIWKRLLSVRSLRKKFVEKLLLIMFHLDMMPMKRSSTISALRQSLVSVSLSSGRRAPARRPSSSC